MIQIRDLIMFAVRGCEMSGVLITEILMQELTDHVYILGSPSSFYLSRSVCVAAPHREINL